MKSSMTAWGWLSRQVTPCVGVWIEIAEDTAIAIGLMVTPCVGVWIEILTVLVEVMCVMSLPAWECGLKSWRI